MRITTRPLGAIMAVSLLAASATPAFAAAPSNDEIGSPISVGLLPYTNIQDTTEATTGATDPDCDGAGPTVWYEHTAAEDTRLEANTFGSDYDTTLYVGTPDGSGGIDLIACNDDAGAGVQSRIRFDAEQGQTYLFMIGAFGGGSGGELVFNLDVAPPTVPLELSITVDSRGTFARDGSATVSGTADCAGGDGLYLDVMLEQRVGRFTVRGFGDALVACEADGTWQIQVNGVTGSFAGGRATASVYAETWNDEDYTSDFIQASLRLGK